MASPEQYDLIIIGAGPAGLTAAITAESQHIETLILDDNGQLGGQAATATYIENFPGFPDGICGQELMKRVVQQALKFTTEFAAPARAVHIESTEDGIVVQADDGEEFLGRAALLSIGVEPRRLRARNLAAYLGQGALYGPPQSTATYPESEIFIIGGSDSAGQAAITLAETESTNVHMLVRGSKLEGRMSGYLIDKVHERENIQVHTSAELVAVDGKGQLEAVSVKKNGDTRSMKADRLFVLIGGVPKTLWLPDAVERDIRGYVKSGNDISAEHMGVFTEQTEGRMPFAHETSMPGLFVAGDVRCGIEKWATLAAFDGASVVPELHRLRIHNSLQA